MKFNKRDNYPIEYIEALYGINLCINPPQFWEITELLPELKYFKNHLETRRHFGLKLEAMIYPVMQKLVNTLSP